MLKHGRQPLVGEICAFAHAKTKPPPEGRFLKGLEQLFDVAHGSAILSEEGDQALSDLALVSGIARQFL